MRTLINAAAIAALSLSASPLLAQTSQGQSTAGNASQSQADQNVSGNFASNAAQNSYAEIMLSGLALQKTDNPRIRHFADMMLEHHSPAIQKLMQRISDSEITVPVMPSEEQMQSVERLQGLSGQEFDQAYVQYQVEAHQKAVNLFEQGAESAQTEDLQMFAMQMLPIMRAHLEIAQQNAERANQ